MIGADICEGPLASMRDPDYPSRQLVFFDCAHYFLSLGFKRAPLRARGSGIRLRMTAMRLTNSDSP